MATMTLNSVLREIHRLRRHLRDLQNEIDGLPRLKKAHQAKVARQEKVLKDAQDAIKQLKAATNDTEVNLKTTHQRLQKHERQMNDLKSPKEVEAMQTEIANEKVLIVQHEESILAGMTEIDERVGKLPPIEDQLKKAKAEFAAFEAEFKEREARLLGELKLAQQELKKVDVQLPAEVRNHYERLVKAHGPDALAMIKERERSCGNCQNSVTVQNINELKQGRLLSCHTCGRVLYLVETPA